MKITDLALFVLLIFLGVSIKLDMDQRRLIQAEELKTRYNEVMFTATEDATMSLLQPDSNTTEDILKLGYDKRYMEVNPNLDRAIERFYETLYENMGIENDKVAQDAFKMHVPVKVVIAYDGYYVNSWHEVYNSSTGKNELLEMWSPKKPYSYYDVHDKLVVNFTLDDLVYIYNLQTGAMQSERRAQLSASYPGALFSQTSFDNVRRQTIVECIQKELGYYSVRYNNIAKQLGLGYIYSIPLIPEDAWSNTIKSTCFIAFLQGLPVGAQSYNTYGFGGARVVAASMYFGNTINGINYYHEEGCSQAAGSNIKFDSRREAAQNGYYPCPVCKP
ncbi:MAG: hypothetical protein FIA99_07170 [Ruminiclostridium sp.]|nr:hypothetical protein [Ruminiclostridium sp.]